MGKHNSKLAPKEIKELSSKTGYTSAEIKEWYKGFLRDCPSGTLNREEFQKVYANFFPNGDSTEFAEHVFQTYDRNGDGNIDFREFLTAMSVTSRGTMEEKLLWAFELYDLNKDGSITKEEMTELIAAIYKMVNVDANPSTSDEPRKSPAERADEIFAIMDRNSDARLTFDEFYEGAKTDASLLRFLEGQS